MLSVLLTPKASLFQENDFWNYRPQPPFSSWHGPCNASEHIRDLWDTDKPAIALADGTYEEEILFRRATEIIERHPPSDPLFLYCKNSHRSRGLIHPGFGMLRGMSLAYCQALPLQMRSTLCTARSKCPKTGYTSLTSSMTRRRDRPIMPWLHTWIRYSHALTSASQIFFAPSSPNAPQVVGNVTTQIRAKGSMWQNTLIVMSSDNVRLRLNGFGPPFLDRFATD